MSTSKYINYKVRQIMESLSEDSLLLLANELVRLKDEQGVNLFWDEHEEKEMRACVDNAIKYCNN